MIKSSFVVLGLAALVSLSLAFTQHGPVYKNLKVLPKNITEKQLDSVMDHFSLSLGVGCDFCHVENKATQVWDFATDSRKHKLIARDMMRMTTKINEKYFNMTGKINLDSKLMVTCFTCHNGKPEPEVKPVVPPVLLDEKAQADSLKGN